MESEKKAKLTREDSNINDFTLDLDITDIKEFKDSNRKGEYDLE